GTRDIDEVMRDAGALIERHLVGADVEATIDRGGIAADDLAAESLRQRNAEGTLANCCGAQNRNETRPAAHWSDSARTNASTTSTPRSSIRPICWEREGRRMREARILRF